MAALSRPGRPAGRGAEVQGRSAAGGPAQVDDVREHAIGDLYPLRAGAGGDEVGRGGNRAHAGGLRLRGSNPRCGGPVTTPSSSSRVGSGTVSLKQEAVQLRLGQWIGPLVLDRVLGRRDQERLGKRHVASLDRYLPLLHHLRAATPASWAASG